MQPIAPPIKPNHIGPIAANLVDAVLLLVRNGRIKALVAPNRPTEKELSELVAAAKKELPQQVYGQASQQLVQFFQVQQGLGDQLRGSVDEKTAAALNEALREIGALPTAGLGTEVNRPASDDPRSVNGTVVDERGRPLPGLSVRAFDRDLRNDELLGQATTDTQGRYQIAYTSAQFRRAEKASADLRVRVLSADGKVELAASATVFNAPARAQIDLAIAADKLNTDSEWERYGRELSPLLGFASIGTATHFSLPAVLSPHELTDEDIDFLHGETGIPAQHLHMVRQAAVWAAARLAQKLPAEVFYGLLRKDLPADWGALLQVSPPALWAALKLAIADRIVPNALGPQLERIIATLTELAVDQQFELPPQSAATRPPLGALIAGSAINPQVQRQIVGLVMDKANNLLPQQLWPMLTEAGIAEADVRSARFAMEAHELIGGHLPTLKALQTSVGKGFGTGADLAQLDRAQWLTVATAVAGKDGKGLPAGVASAEAYAESLADGVELAFPTAVVAHQLKLDKVPARQAVGQVLVLNPGFDLLQSSVEDFAAKANLEGIQVPREVLVKQLGAEARMARIAPAKNRAKHMQTLHSLGFDSAVKVVMTGKGSFKGQVGKSAGAAQADEMFSKAKARAGDLALHATRIRDHLDLSWFIGGRAPAVAPGSSLANWVDMFGSANGCSCPPCESVYGPAAYLMDLLQFLKEMEARQGSADTLFDVLMKHRPDLQHLKLNCANAETPLPYIDLVIELLERTIKNVGPTAADYAGSIPQTPESLPGETNVAARLRALPEQQASTRSLYEAGGELLAAGTTYPWNLPFDRNFQRTAIDLDLIGAPAAEALALTVAPGDHLARARLGMDLATWTLLHNTQSNSAPDVAAAWGFPRGDALESLLAAISGEKGLLARSGLAVEELFALVECPLFAGWNLFIDRQPDPCNIDNAKVKVRLSGGISRNLSSSELPEVFDLMHRCLRLRLQLGWPLARLQLVLQALGVGKDVRTIDLVDLASLIDLAARLGVTPETLAQRLLALQVAVPESAQSAPATAAWLAMLNLSPDEHDRLVTLGLPNSLVAPSAKPRLANLESALSMLGLLKSARIDSAELDYLLSDRDLTPAVFQPKEEQLDAGLDGVVKAMRDASGNLPEGASADEAAAAQGAAAIQSLRDITGAAFVQLVLAGDPGSAASVPPIPPRSPLLKAASGSNAALHDFLFLATSPPTAAARESAKSTLRRTLKTCRLLSVLGFVEADVRALASLQDAGRALFDFNTLLLGAGTSPPTLATLRPLLQTSVTQAAMPKADQRLTELMSQAGDNAAAAIDRLEQVTGWGRAVSGPTSDQPSSAALKTLAATIALGDSVLATWQTPGSYASLLAAVNWLQAHRIQVAPTNELHLMLSAARQEVAADLPALQAAVRSRFATLADWYKALTPAMDRLRVRQRDALLAYLLHKVPTGATEPRWKTPDQIYEDLLIDVQMGPCQLSSRLVQAHGAVQLFVQRCLMNLMDPGEVALGDVSNISQWREWEWRKNYRVWEAGRKVFLYPENWIEPDLRDVKSPFFEALEDELLQGEITPELVERAVRNYLTQLHEVAKLDIRALYEEKYQELGGDGSLVERRVIHMVGRTLAPPHVYYYRKRHDNLSWNPWEKIDLSIDTDHLALAVHNRRPMLFWPRWKEVQPDATSPSGRAWDLSLNLSMLEFGTWCAPVVSRDRVRLAADANLSAVSLRPRIATAEDGNEALEILVYDFENWSAVVTGGKLGACVAASAFRLDNCTGELGSVRLASAVMRLLPPAVVPIEQALVEGVGGGPAQTFLRVGPGSEPERLLSNDLLTVEDLLENGGLGGIIVAAFMAGSESLRAEVSSLSRDDAWQIPLLTGRVEGYRVVPCQQFAQFDQNQPYVLVHEGRLLHAVRKITDASEVRYGGRSAPLYVLEAGDHPFVCDLLEAVRAEGLDGVYRPRENDPAPLASHRHARQLTTSNEGWVRTTLAPNNGMVSRNYPVDEFDFRQFGAYELYNWELFFHIPLLLAERLSKVQRFEDAQKWFHTIFDPTDVSAHPGPEKYWRVKPLFQLIKDSAEHAGEAIETIEAMMRRLAQGAPDLETQVEAWRADPFNPHLIARLRLVAYMKTVVRKYIENLIAWADELFRRDTMESINEATQLYVRGLEVLGKAPVTLPPATRTSRSYAELASAGSVDDFSNLLVGLETGLPLSRAASAPAGRAAPSASMLYFCIPANSMLTDLRTKISDRLFKLRHCMDIDGNLRQLALFAPPIDPALLVRARAAGLDLSAALSMALSTPSSTYRFQPLLQKALEYCGEVRSFGGALLSALEKRDGEQLSQMRARHESVILDLARLTRKQQIKEAEANLEAANRSREVVVTRRDFFEANVNEGTSPGEQAQLSHLHTAHAFELTSSSLNAAAAIAHLFPDITVGFTPGATWGGSNLGSWLSGAAATLGLFAQQYSFEASMSGYAANFSRRAKEWQQQVDTANRELAQIDQQIVAAQIRLDMAEQELRNHEQQIAHSQEVESYLRDKFTDTQLYSWMAGQLATLHYQSYRMAFDLARQAEAAAVRELGRDDEATIRLDGWDGGHKGLLAGERLAQDLRRLELSYMRRNQRRLETTTNISLRRLDPAALWRLRTDSSTGEFTLPTWLFDMDFPGHLDRRIKSVSVSIPGVVGPYGGVSGMLRCTPGGHAGQSVIATSTGQSDAGVFQLDFRDERYLPFEGVELSPPAEARWSFTLSGLESFDHDTISDMILHVQYTARPGMDDGSSALNDVLNQLCAEDRPPLAILLSPRHDFPLEYRRLVEGGSDATVRIELDNQLFPYFARNRRITAVTELAGGASPPTGTFDGFSASDGTINLAQSNASSVFLVKYVLVRST